jgi:predicted nucleotidyltransferase component of viral defense system
MPRTPANAHHLHQLIRDHARATGQVYEDILRATSQAVLCQLLVSFGAAEKFTVFVKGGVSLLVRYGIESARYTRDFDASLKFDDESDLELEKQLSEAAWSGFHLREIRALPRHVPENVHSRDAVIGFRARLMLGQSEVTSVTVEFSRDELETGEWVSEQFPQAFEPLLQALQLPPLEPVRAIPKHIHLAQKIHAVTDPAYFRARDLYDIALILTGDDLQLTDVLAVAKEIFQLRKRQSWPPSLDTRYLDEGAYSLAVGPKISRIPHAQAIAAFKNLLKELIALEKSNLKP